MDCNGMASFSNEEIAKYAHSPAHLAVARRDHTALRRITSAIPKLTQAGEILTETDADAEELRAEAVSSVLDRRDVSGRETPLHLAVRLGDTTSAEILLAAGIDWTLQNEQGWSALQEAICTRQKAVAMVIMRYYQPLAWAKWCRRLPRVVAAMQKVRDFYMEVTFHFESSVIPFISRIAPSDTYRIWKRGSNLRVNMTLAGFDGFRMQRTDQSFLFLGEGSQDGKLAPGSLCILKHKSKEIMNALEGAGKQPTEEEIASDVEAMSQTNMYRPGIDVTQAYLQPQLTWRKQEKTEVIGPWNAQLYDMHHIIVSIKSRRVPGAMMDDEPSSQGGIEREDGDPEGFTGILTDDEKRQLETVLAMDNVEADENSYGFDNRASALLQSADDMEEDKSASGMNQHGLSREGKKGWFVRAQQSLKREGMKKAASTRSSLRTVEKMSALLGESSSSGKHIDGDKHQEERKSVDGRCSESRSNHAHYRDSKKSSTQEQQRRRRKRTARSNSSGENEYKKRLKPVLWLTSSFPLKTEELLPLLDILASKVKPIGRLREILTTKLPSGTFPVKVAIPVIPTIRLIVTFKKFEDFRPTDKFAMPSTTTHHSSELVSKGDADNSQTSASRSPWIKGPAIKAAGVSGTSEASAEEVGDLFVIPEDYSWTSLEFKRQRVAVLNHGMSKKVLRIF